MLFIHCSRASGRKGAIVTDKIRLTHYGHACVLAELPDGTRILFDPGSYSAGFEDLAGLDAVLITHEHPDHHDTQRQPRLAKANPGARVVTVAEAADTVTVGGAVVQVRRGTHAVIHPDLPNVDNHAYQVGDLLFHPGDSFTQPDGPVRVLLLPAGGPWMKLGESVDYLRAVAPEIAVPIHQAGLAGVHQQLHHQVLRGLAPTGTTVAVLDHGAATAL
jgi:L-ascorbate metabolism protein UlaG (beta-lactamase superfamily)